MSGLDGAMVAAGIDASLARRDAAVRQAERERILALLDDPTVRKAISADVTERYGRHGLSLAGLYVDATKHQIGGAA